MTIASALNVTMPSLRAELAAVRQESDALLSPLTAAQMSWRPAPSAWSSGEVAAHLRTTNELYLKKMGPALDGAPRGGALRPHRPSLVGGLLLKAMTAARRVPAPKAFVPQLQAAEVRDWSEELARYRATHDGLEEMLRRADGVDLTSVRLASPVSPLLRMNLGDAFTIWLAHERRHMGQLRRIRESPGFPAA